MNKNMKKEIITIGIHEQSAIDQANNCLNEAEAIFLMADGHKGYGMPVGGVAVYKDRISPAGVGFDIACGNKAVKLDVKYSDIKDRLENIAQDIWEQISFGIGQKNNTKVEHELFDNVLWTESNLLKTLKDKAQAQLGTIGSGNHYIDVFKDEDDYIWIGVHFGSRGFGHTIASHFMKLAGDNVNIMDETPHTLDVNSTNGQDYIKAMQLAGEYAYAGRDWVCKKVSEIIKANIVEEIHNHHNFAWEETHNGEKYWVVRKGATPAFPNQKGFVGGSMGENSVIIEGVDSQLSKSIFYSTVHGAGRVMSRTMATGKKKKIVTERIKENGEKYNFTEWQVTSKGLVNFDEVKKEMKEKGIILLGAGADEAPQVYKRLNEVLDFHKETIKILHTLTPLIVCMAGKDEFDPYKD